MYKILIADDEIKIRNTIKDYLTAKGLSVITASDGEDAVEKTEETEFDLIILDVMMPKKDGLKACEEIRKWSNVPILFLPQIRLATESVIRCCQRQIHLNQVFDFLKSEFLPP